MWRAAAVALIGAGARRRGAADLGCRGRRRGARHRAPGLDVRRLHRPVRQGAAAARLPGLPAGLHGLPRPEARALPQPRRARRAGVPGSGGQGACRLWPYQISGELDDQGNPIDRLPGLADPIIGPYKNDKQARAAQNGALPPDLSLIAKARTVESHAPWYSHWLYMLRDMATGYQEGGADYLYALLTGYHEPPAGMQMTEGMNYNVAFPGHQLAMPPPLGEGQLRRVPAGVGLQRLARAERARRHGLPRLGGRPDPQRAASSSAGRCCCICSSPPCLLYLVKKRIWSRVKH